MKKLVNSIMLLCGTAIFFLSPVARAQVTCTFDTTSVVPFNADSLPTITLYADGGDHKLGSATLTSALTSGCGEGLSHGADLNIYVKGGISGILDWQNRAWFPTNIGGIYFSIRFYNLTNPQVSGWVSASKTPNVLYSPGNNPQQMAGSWGMELELAQHGTVSSEDIKQQNGNIFPASKLTIDTYLGNQNTVDNSKLTAPTITDNIATLAPSTCKLTASTNSLSFGNIKTDDIRNNKNQSFTLDNNACTNTSAITLTANYLNHGEIENHLGGDEQGMLNELSGDQAASGFGIYFTAEDKSGNEVVLDWQSALQYDYGEYFNQKSLNMKAYLGCADDCTALAAGQYDATATFTASYQ